MGEDYFLRLPEPMLFKTRCTQSVLVVFILANIRAAEM